MLETNWLNVLNVGNKIIINQITECPEQKNIRNVIVHSYVYEQYTMSYLYTVYMHNILQ